MTNYNSPDKNGLHWYRVGPLQDANGLKNINTFIYNEGNDFAYKKQLSLTTQHFYGIKYIPQNLNEIAKQFIENSHGFIPSHAYFFTSVYKHNKELFIGLIKKELDKCMIHASPREIAWHVFDLLKKIN